MTQRLLRWICLFLACGFFQAAVVVAQDRFTDNGDGTVTDHKLGLMWSKTDNSGNISWKQATRWVQYTFPDTLQKKYDNWRLPTLEELKSLYNADPGYEGYEADCGQQVKIIPLIRLSCGWAWSSDVETITAAVFSFQRGIHYTDRMVHRRGHRALPVRTIR